MDIYRLGKLNDSRSILEELGVQSGGVSIISSKMELYYFYIKELPTPAANILKQDALSIGAELAVPSGVITCTKDYYDCILIGTKKHIEILSRKELAQPFGLKRVAKELQKFLKSKSYSRKIMAIINANSDSFYEGSRYLSNDAIVQIKRVISDGADIIDIGAVSSRPYADVVEKEEELSRIKPICDAIYDTHLYRDSIFSIDSYTPSVVEYALQRGFSIVNDITGAKDEQIIELAIKYKAKLVIMHMQGTPQDMQNNPHYDDVMVDVSAFFERQIERCEEMGLDREYIILDVGIGFGKSLDDNLTLIRNLSHFQKFGCELLIGASRKSLIDHITPTPINDRLAGTLAIHLKALEGGASIIRCHDVAPHLQAIRVYEAML
ncbi:Alternative dihydrofolate reductase 2 / Dihydropteroate synthase [hydrothermal vent metagenome]|uniref:dihydropteroate synthase n=1 Tax=hydrothermal vent metagenome TaxID=652676 RepID=A0A1W1B8J8_9ZZZZ